MRGLVRHMVTGLLVKAGDAGALAGAISQLRDDQELRKRLGEQGRRTVEQEYTMEIEVSRYLELFQRISADW